ncbi:MAG: hypothetical protein HWE16_14245 [Gammaproteobacteria bacterium]|nr:hypothetical protein [Gammaproteobacteria bacterium]
MKYLIFCVSLLISCQVKSNELFVLTIEPSFKPIETYEVQLNDLDKPHRFFIVKRTYKDHKALANYEDLNEAFEEISENEYAQIVSQLKSFLKTLKFDDDTSGWDGETWTLKTSVFQRLEIAIWSPDIDSKKRGYSKLISLKNSLDKHLLQANKD